MKTLYVFQGNYGQLFFDENKNPLAYIHENDGEWRGEYFDDIIEGLGIKVKEALEKDLTDNLKILPSRQF